jgi:hypothetical protein
MPQYSKDFTRITSTYGETAQAHTYYVYPSTRKLLNHIKEVHGISLSKIINIAVYDYYKSLPKPKP